jgi:hypothetical protein
MKNPFKIPYRETGSKRSRLVASGIFGLFIFLFLYLFKPFGISELPSGQQFFFCLGFGAITIFVLLIMKLLIEPVVIGENWTLGKDLLWDLFVASCIGIANYCYISIIYHVGFMPKYMLYAIWTAILVGSIPVTVIHILEYNKMYRNALVKADITPGEVFWEDEVRITAGNDKNDLRVDPRSIIFLCSNDNYVTVAIKKENIVSKVTIRGTLKSAEEELRKNKRFFRCHKCYIVNLDYVDRISGHSQNMKIRLLNSDELIPVSRSKAGELAACTV